MEIPRITADELKAMMDQEQNVIIVDVRQPAAYAGSSHKIRGAVYVDPNDENAILKFAKDLDKNRAIVAY